MTQAKWIAIIALFVAVPGSLTVRAHSLEIRYDNPSVKSEAVNGYIDSLQTESFFLRYHGPSKLISEKILVTPHTLITIDGIEAKFSDLKPGYLARVIGQRPNDLIGANRIDVVTEGSRRAEKTRQLISVLFAAGGGGGGGGSGIGGGGEPSLNPPPEGNPIPDVQLPCIHFPCGITLPTLDCLVNGIDFTIVTELLELLPSLESELLSQQGLADDLIQNLLATTDGTLDVSVQLLITKLERVCLILECVDGTTNAAAERLHTVLSWKLNKVCQTLRTVLNMTGELPDQLLETLCLDLRSAASAALHLVAKTSHTQLGSLNDLAGSLLQIADCSENLIGIDVKNILKQKQAIVGSLLKCIVPCEGIVTDLVAKVDPLKGAVAWKLR